MRKCLFILVLMAVVVSISQPTAYGQPPKCETYMDLNRAVQGGPPSYSPIYYPCGSWFDWHTSFNVDVNAYGYTIIRFSVLRPDPEVADWLKHYDSRFFEESGRYDDYGTHFTGLVDLDQLKISEVAGNGTDNFESMHLDVEYYNKPDTK